MHWKGEAWRRKALKPWTIGTADKFHHEYKVQHNFPQSLADYELVALPLPTFLSLSFLHLALHSILLTCISSIVLEYWPATCHAVTDRSGWCRRMGAAAGRGGSWRLLFFPPAPQRSDHWCWQPHHHLPPVTVRAHSDQRAALFNLQQKKKASTLPNCSPLLGSQTASSWSGRGLVLVGGKLVRGSNSHLVRITASTHRLYCSIFLLGIQNGCKPGHSLHWEMWEVVLLMSLFFSCNKASTPCSTQAFCNILFILTHLLGVQAK